MTRLGQSRTGETKRCCAEQEKCVFHDRAIVASSS
jgi:hypothetical protein